MIIFNSDLDNTMIFSYKHDIGEHKRNVEQYQGREISFITEKTYELLQQVQEKVLFVPTTTRTKEQYERINFQIGKIKYALTCNGGVLLVDGIEDEEWYNKSLEMISGCKSELKKAQEYLEKDARRTFEVRNIKELFIFTKCNEPESVVADLKQILDLNQTEVFHNGVKVYAVPKALSKGIALQRFKQYMSANQTIAAGDSEFDVSMLREADLGLAPKALMEKFQFSSNVVGMEERHIFSESVLGYVLDYVEKNRIGDV
ncbi:HAD family hydrolase [Anaeromicropila populeti]|uniref:Hydroxymethylpyrimidine pyrophosphatase n=1 Tax=Anaeromicropila populeti TaxID=37658 RepID=A0A1I6IFE8_9FIRM|nr:HAD hydrolase family protein [Anaeromicropila populeti]SFR65391.1 Hydroxymethylpyrimidine pyrophosphatase [Anaeromicropila populeti]